MGIENLLNFIKPALTESSITAYKNKKAAVDAMSWLYRGCYSCAYELNQNIETNDYIYYIQKMLLMLKEYQITPILVFDGRKLKAKEKTEQHRKQLKVQNLEKGKELIESGNQGEAKKYLQRCLKITKKMLYLTFDVLRQLEIQFIIAPYEADAQIAHLCLTGETDFAITEDSDLICYFCPLIVFKLQSDGSCYELSLQKLRESRNNRIHIKDEDVRQFLAFTNQQLLDVCIMSGCDYVPSIRGIGIKKAIILMNQHQNIENIIQKLKKNKQFSEKIPLDYEKLIKATRLIFLYQTIYDKNQKKWIQLNQTQYEESINQQLQELQINESSLLIGEKIQEDLQELFSKGDLDIKTLILREHQKIDFNQLFKRTERRLQNYQQNVIVDLETKQKVQEFLQSEDAQNLPDFVDKTTLEIRDQQFLTLKKKQVQQQEQDVFRVCEDMFNDYPSNQISQDQLNIPTQHQENEIILNQFNEQTPQKNIIDENSSSSNEINPFACKTQIKNTQCLSQIKNNHSQIISTEKKNELKSEKVLKSGKTTIFSFFKK